MPSWMKFAMLFLMGLVMVVCLGDNNETDAGWYPGKFAGRVIVNGVHRRQDRRAARREARSCGGAEVQVQTVSAVYSDCSRSVEAAVPAPAPVSVVAPMMEAKAAPPPTAPVAPEFSPEEERELRERIADMRQKLKLLEDMVDIRKRLVSH